MGTRGIEYYHYSVMDDVSLFVIICSYLIYLSIYLYQINFMFRYLSVSLKLWGWMIYMGL